MVLQHLPKIFGKNFLEKRIYLFNKNSHYTAFLNIISHILDKESVREVELSLVDIIKVFFTWFF